MPFEKNQLLEVEFVDITHEGAGVAKPEGFPIFVPGAIPGEKAEIKITKILKSHGFGRLMNVLEPSESRVEPPCSVYKQCGGCSMQHLSYDAQLKSKHKVVSDVMQRIGKLTDVKIHPVLGMENPWHYRNKAQVPVGSVSGNLITGFYANRSHDIIDMKSCPIQTEENDKAVQVVREICNKYNVSVYNERTRKGVLRHILTRYGKNSGELMIVLVTNGKPFPNKDAIAKEIVAALPSVKSIVQNVNIKNTNVVLGDKSFAFWGRDVIYDTIGDVKFAISAKSFYQVNPDQTKVLYDKALEYAALTGEETVVDAYCGIGTISLFLAQKAKSVFGIEIVEQAIEDARKNAKLNKIENAEFAVGEAEVILPEWEAAGNKADVVVVDPPRKGCDERLLQSILKMSPKRVVYVSCNPGTLARDLRFLEDGGYKTVEIQPVDMFPHTGHVECCVLLTLQK